MDNHILKKCEMCDNIMELKLNTNKNSINYGEIIVIHKNKRFCSRECQIKWQKSIKWEDRIGLENANKIRIDTSNRVSGDKNPTKNKEIAEKVSNSLKKYLKENPRVGEKNPMYGKNHTDEYKDKSSKDKKGKRSYNIEGYNKLLENTPKGESHPNWLGGISNGDYPFDFSKSLKNKIKNRDNYHCKICDKKTNKLAIHHIDYNKQNTNEDNLISLCYNCHSITNYNRSEWELFLSNIIKKNNKNE